MGVYSGFKSCHYFNVWACALCFTTFSMPITPDENRYLAFESLISNAEVENAMISDCIIVCSKFSGI